MTDKDTLAKLAQDMRALASDPWGDSRNKRLADRLDALAAQQVRVGQECWRQAIAEWRSLPASDLRNNIDWIECRALELSAGSGEDK